MTQTLENQIQKSAEMYSSNKECKCCTCLEDAFKAGAAHVRAEMEKKDVRGRIGPSGARMLEQIQALVELVKEQREALGYYDGLCCHCSYAHLEHCRYPAREALSKPYAESIRSLFEGYGTND